MTVGLLPSGYSLARIDAGFEQVAQLRDVIREEVEARARRDRPTPKLAQGFERRRRRGEHLRDVVAVIAADRVAHLKYRGLDRVETFLRALLDRHRGHLRTSL